MSAAAAKLRALDARIDQGLDVDTGEYVQLEAEARIEQRQAEAANRRRADDAARAERAKRDAKIRAVKVDLWEGVDRVRERIETVLAGLRGRDDLPLSARPLQLRSHLHDVEAQRARFLDAVDRQGNHTHGTPIRNVRASLTDLADDLRVWANGGAITEEIYRQLDAEIAALVALIAPVVEYDR